MKVISRLCNKYTDLNEKEIGIIQMMADVLQPLANLEDADIFVDCACKDGDAIVVAEAKPSSGCSSYKKSVVGMLAKQENEPAVARTLRLGIPTKHMKAITQECTHVIQSVEPIKNADKVIGVLIREKRTYDEYATSERFHLSNPNFEAIAGVLSRMVDDNNWLTECIDEAVLMVDDKGTVTFRNTLAKDLYLKLGYFEDVLGQQYENIRLIDDEEVRDVNPHSFIETKVGKHFLSIRHVTMRESEIAFSVIMRDITCQKEQEKELILKSVAIKEMHHRVKNNLQTIASLIRLQARRTNNEETEKVLGETMNRILSISATHELLAQSGVDQIKIGEVIMHIKNNTVRYFARPQFDVKILIEGDDFFVDSDIATSVALVINELLQNSLQYAFMGEDVGVIKIIVKEGSLYSEIKVIDYGCGFDVDNMRKDRLGMSIVKSLVKDKLHGNFEISSDSNGTRVKFDFLQQTTDLSV